MMTNGDPEGQIFLPYPHTNNGFFFLLTTVVFFSNKATEIFKDYLTSFSVFLEILKKKKLKKKALKKERKKLKKKEEKN